MLIDIPHKESLNLDQTTKIMCKKVMNISKTNMSPDKQA